MLYYLMQTSKAETMPVVLNIVAYTILLLVVSVSGILIVDCIENCTSDQVAVGDALENLNSNTILRFIPGVHVLQIPSINSGFENVSLIGDSHNTIISCEEGAGLAFVDVTGLTIENITVHQCGISEENLSEALKIVKKRTHFFHEVQDSLNVSLLLGNCRDVTLRDVTVRNTTGVGLLGINVLGKSNFTRLNFSSNAYISDTCLTAFTPRNLHSRYEGPIGGGAFLIYSDVLNLTENVTTKLVVDQSTFVNNKDCSIASIVALYLGQDYYSSVTLRKMGYYIGSGGGLSIILTQLNYGVAIYVASSQFQNNEGTHGAGAHVFTFHHTLRANVTIFNCSFTGNGIPRSTSSNSGYHLSSGGGVAIFTNCIRPYSHRENIPSAPSGDIRINISKTNFTNNTAYIGGAVYLWSPGYISGLREKVKLWLESCRFESSSAAFGAAIYAYEQNMNPERGGTQVEVSNSDAINNKIISPDGSKIKSVRQSTGAIDIRYINFTMRNCLVLENNETGLYSQRSIIYLQETVTFKNNTGTFGGAMCLLYYSYLIITSNSNVTFQDNHGSVHGGVFYVDFYPQPVYSYDYRDCFLFLNSSDEFYCDDHSTCSILSDLNINISFIGNSAPQGGIAYGSALSSCFWGRFTRNYSDILNLWHYLYNDSESSVFQFDSDPNGTKYVTTPVANLEVQDRETEYRIMPGQSFNVSLCAMDRLSQPVQAAMSSTVLSANGRVSTRSSGFNVNSSTSETTLTAYGVENSSLRVAFFTVNSFAATEILVALTYCSIEYKYDNVSKSCNCLHELKQYEISCAMDEENITIPNHLWMGPMSINGNKTLAILLCIFDYCNSGTKSIKPGDFNSQCAEGYNRIGLLCGSCAENYSAVLGSNRCKKCEGHHSLLLLIAFAAAGVVLIAIVAFLKVSVSEGYLYGILFYSHIVVQCAYRLDPSNTGAFIPIAFLSLNLGMEVCFYEGMDSLARTGLKFMFPLYIYSLMAMMVILARYFKCPGSINFSAGQTFATLLILSYSNVLQTCIEITSFVNIESVKGNTTLRWLIDPTVKYFTGFHIMLVIISGLLLIMYVIPLPLILLCPSKVYQLKCTKKFKPVFDAFWYSFDPRFRFWLGIRMLSLGTMTAVWFYTQYPTDLFISVTCLVCFSAIQLTIKPFKGVWRNAADNFFLINVIVLFQGALFFDHLNRVYSIEKEKATRYAHTIFSTVTVASAYLVSILILSYHIYKCLSQRMQNNISGYVRDTKLTKKLSEWVTLINDQTRETMKGEAVYYRYEDEESTEFHDERETSSVNPSYSDMHSPLDDEGIIKLTPYTI